MVHISEMRVVMPMTVEEFRRAQRYANWKTNEYNTQEGQGGQLLSSAPYVHETWGEGLYTHSLYRLGDRLPDWVTRLIPSNALVIDEKTWMAYPYCRSVLTIPFFNKLQIEMLSMHKDDDGSTDNVFGLNEDQLCIRKVDFVDIHANKVAKRDYRADLDPALTKSKKTGRGPLSTGWQTTLRPIMCAYKVTTVQANYWGVQSRAEKLMLNGVRQIVLLTHRNAFCYMDSWFDLTYEEICAMEVQGRERLKAAVKQPSIIDPSTGKELVVPDSPKVLSDDSDDSDIEVEFFEAEMDWATQEDEDFVKGLMDGLEDGDRLKDISSSDVPKRCAVCVSRGKEATAPQILCQTCEEHFCSTCFSDMHITSRLRLHVTKLLVTPSQINVTEVTPNLHKEPAGVRTDNLVRTMAHPDNQYDSSETLVETLDVARRAFQQAETSVNPESASSEHAKRPVRQRNRSKSGLRALNTWSEDLETHESGGAEPLSRSLDAGQACQLSEDMVCCISTLYMRCGESRLSSYASPVKRKLWRRSFAEVLPPDSHGESRGDEGSIGPYGTKNEHALWSVDVYLDAVEVASAPVEDKLDDSAGLLYKQYRRLVAQLAHVNPKEMTHEQRLAFWINLYNSLMMHSYLVYGIPRSHYKRILMMNKAAYDLGGYHFSALAIEHAILRANSYRPALATLLPVQKYKRNDERLPFALDRPEPLLSFALCCGSRSSPMVRAYTPATVGEDLQVACQEFLVAAVSVNSKLRRIFVPKILHWYARDFSDDAKSLLEWISQQLPEDKRNLVIECLQQKAAKKKSRRMSVTSYDWSFRYLFDRRLVLKP